MNKEHLHLYGRSCAPLKSVRLGRRMGAADMPARTGSDVGAAQSGDDMEFGGGSGAGVGGVGRLEDINAYVRAERQYVWSAMEAPPLRTVLHTLNISSAGWFAHATDSPSPAGYADCLHWCLPGVPDIWAATLSATLASIVAAELPSPSPTSSPPSPTSATFPSSPTFPTSSITFSPTSSPTSLSPPPHASHPIALPTTAAAAATTTTCEVAWSDEDVRNLAAAQASIARLLNATRRKITGERECIQVRNDSSSRFESVMIQALWLVLHFLLHALLLPDPTAA